MPVLTRDQIKVWFQNLKKPPQEHFWTWLDSFWHKEDKIPQSAVENLTIDLQKKADLVNGVVPEEQLPFSVKTSEKIAIGTCVTTANTVKLNVHSSGSNKVRLQGKIYTRDFPNTFSYTAVNDAAKTKILLLYALSEPGLFFLAEGIEGIEETDPELPEGALLIYRIKVQLSGQIVDGGGGPGFKYTSDDSFRTVTCGIQALDIHFGTLFSGTLNIESTVSNPRIKGISTKFNKGIWDGRMLVFKNNTGTDLPLLAESEEPWPGRTFLSFDKEYTLKKDQYGFVLIRMADKKLLLVSTGGGGAEFPAAAENGLALVSDASEPAKVKWYGGFFDKLTTTAQSVASFVTFSGNFRSKRHYFSVDDVPDTSPSKMWTDGADLYFTDNSGVNRRIGQIGKIYEHNVKGKVLTSDASGNFSLNLNAYTRWILTLTDNTTLAVSNQIADDETITISLNVTGKFTLTFPNWLKQSPYSDLYDGSKINRIVIEIGKGGTSPSGWYNIIKFNS